MWTIYDGLPDNTISEQDMVDYGFTDRTMLPIATQSTALNIFKESDLKLYALGTDNSKSLIESEAELSTWIGIFGVNKAEWMNYNAGTACRKARCCEKHDRNVGECQTRA